MVLPGPAAATRELSGSPATVLGGRSRSDAGTRSGLGTLVALFALDKVILKLADAVATAGFIGHLGSARLPWLWTADMIFTLVTGSVLLRAVDRVPHATLLRRMALALGGLYLVAALGAWAHLPGEWVYTLTYLLSAQQSVVLPTVLWVLANSRVPTELAPRVHPRIAAGETAGQVAGYLLCAVLGWLGTRLVGDRVLLLLAAAGCALLAALSVSQDRRPLPARMLAEDAEDTEVSTGLSLRQILSRHRVLFPLAATVTLNWIGASCMSFHVIVCLERASAGDATDSRFRMLYALYNVGSILTILVLQALLSSRTLPKFRRTSALGLYPAVLTVTLLTAAVWPSAVGAVASAFAMYLAADAWDVPARHSLLSTLPEEVRGRATTLVDNHAYALGCVIGALMLGVVVTAGPHLGVSPIALGRVYLSIGALAAMASSGAAWWMRRYAEVR